MTYPGRGCIEPATRRRSCLRARSARHAPPRVWLQRLARPYARPRPACWAGRGRLHLGAIVRCAFNARTEQVRVGRGRHGNAAALALALLFFTRTRLPS
jgi:hypothetical protein